MEPFDQLDMMSERGKAIIDRNKIYAIVQEKLGKVSSLVVDALSQKAHPDAVKNALNDAEIHIENLTVMQKRVEDLFVLTVQRPNNPEARFILDAFEEFSRIASKAKNLVKSLQSSVVVHYH